MAHRVGSAYSRFVSSNWDMFCFRLCSYSADKKSRDLASTLSALTSYPTCFSWLMTAHLVILFSEFYTLKETMLQKENKARSFTRMGNSDDLNSLTSELCVCLCLPSKITIKITSMCFKNCL